jgi:hypothetical protein
VILSQPGLAESGKPGKSKSQRSSRAIIKGPKEKRNIQAWENKEEEGIETYWMV